MHIEIQWNQEDIEQRLREELTRSGFRILEKPDGSAFKWTTRPKLTVRVKAEPDPGVAAQQEERYIPIRNVQEEEEEEKKSILDPDLLPPGVDPRIVKALEKAAAAEEKGKLRRKLMKGETYERPDE